MENYPFENRQAALAGFFTKPWDTRSACLAVVSANGNSRAAAAYCLPLGAPTIFVCGSSTMDWYKLTPAGPSEPHSVPAAQIEGFFREHSAELAPEKIYAAKMRRPGANVRQLWFVDAGLMPSVERLNGETLHRLVESSIKELAAALGGRLRGHKAFTDLYKTVFWLLAAKLLKEKGVDNFKRIALTDVDDVFRRVGKHYADVDDLPPGGTVWRPAIDAVAHSIATWGHFGNISTESLAYLYETALIDKNTTPRSAKKGKTGTDIRKELGIHSTPPVLIDHMLAQLWPLIEQINPSDRNVFEPACGHAGFLVAAMRWLREFSGLSEGIERHQYLRDRLHGIEVDPFAHELAKLSLTLSDVPYGNSWRINNKDMYEPGLLERAAKECTVLLANPPFESFSPSDKVRYQRLGQPVTAITKTVEMLKRTLPHMQSGSVFGFVAPQGVLYDRASRCVREFLHNECELTEISLFADNLFEQADHETTILLGRRKSPKQMHDSLWYRRVRERGITAFKKRLAFSCEFRVNQSAFTSSEGVNYYLPELYDVWNYLSTNPTLNSLANVGQGLAYHGKYLPTNAWTIHDPPHENDNLGYAKVPSGLNIYSLPPAVGMNLEQIVLRYTCAGLPTGCERVLLNYARVSREAWKLKAMIDPYGRAITSRFISIQPRESTTSCVYLWALLNSPIANAFAYSQTMKRDILVGTIRKLPIPSFVPTRIDMVIKAALAYLKLARQLDEFMTASPSAIQINNALLRMDAEVLKLYDLPPRLERQLLDLFWGVERKGVGCEFRGYFPPDFKPCIPLHEYLSDDYKRSTAGRIRENLRPVQSKMALAMLDAAESYAAGE
ncbi:MAG: N-6 DNA methylase [Phycisphaerales bacterium]|nr:N-6 DNA methylase [Phycisphaerales bacterium]